MQLRASGYLFNVKVDSSWPFTDRNNIFYETKRDKVEKQSGEKKHSHPARFRSELDKAKRHIPAF